MWPQGFSACVITGLKHMWPEMSLVTLFSCSQKGKWISRKYQTADFYVLLLLLNIEKGCCHLDFIKKLLLMLSANVPTEKHWPQANMKTVLCCKTIPSKSSPTISGHRKSKPRQRNCTRCIFSVTEPLGHLRSHSQPIKHLPSWTPKPAFFSAFFFSFFSEIPSPA